MSIPIKMALDKWFTAEVIDIIDETEHAKRFFFQAPQFDVFQFKPGQFITFDLPIHEKKTKRVRSYSIASAPTNTNEFELVISYVPQGLATNYLWKEVQIGTKLMFRGPLGNFILPEKIETDLCFVATGTGIAPFRSMLLDLKNHPRATGNIFLVFGTRYEKDILYYKEMMELELHPAIGGTNFKFQTALSRETSIGYAGFKGYVHPVYEKLFSDKRAANFYLCGWRNMIDEAQQRILAMGYDGRHIHIELYG